MIENGKEPAERATAQVKVSDDNDVPSSRIFRLGGRRAGSFNSSFCICSDGGGVASRPLRLHSSESKCLYERLLCSFYYSLFKLGHAVAMVAATAAATVISIYHHLQIEA